MPEIPDWVKEATVKIVSTCGDAILGVATGIYPDSNRATVPVAMIIIDSYGKVFKELSQEKNSFDVDIAEALPTPGQLVIWVDDDMRTQIGVYDATGARRPLTKLETSIVLASVDRAMEFIKAANSPAKNT